MKETTTAGEQSTSQALAACEADRQRVYDFATTAQVILYALLAAVVVGLIVEWWRS